MHLRRRIGHGKILPHLLVMNGFVGSYPERKLRPEISASRKHSQNSKVACAALAAGRDVPIDDFIVELKNSKQKS